jgi:hypothetical protein
MGGELVQRIGDVVSGASVGVPVGVNAIGCSMCSLIITITFIIKVIAIAPPAITGRVAIYLTNLAAYINEGSGSMVWAPLTSSITAPIITAWLVAPIITTRLLTTPIITAHVITTPVIIAPVITALVLTTPVIAASIIIITGINVQEVSYCGGGC